MADKIIYLEDCEPDPINCPGCKSTCFQFLPDIKSSIRDYGRFISREWKCIDCGNIYFKTEARILNKETKHK